VGPTPSSIKSDRLKPNEAMRLLDDYEKSLTLYTYLNFDDQHSPAANGRQP
jgi:arginine decarboxylase